jgi:hypothetical protein
MGSFKYEVNDIAGYPTLAISDRIYPIEPFHTIHLYNFVSAGNLLVKEGHMDHIPWEKEKKAEYDKAVAKYKRYKWLPKWIRRLLGMPMLPPVKIDVVCENCRAFGLED